MEGGGGEAGGGEKGVANILSYDQVLFVLSGPSVVDRTFNANLLPPPPPSSSRCIKTVGADRPGRGSWWRQNKGRG